MTEQREPKNYTLLGLNTGYTIGNSLKALGEVAQGGDETQRGAAWDVELSGSPVEQLNLKSYYRKVDAGFLNPTVGSGGLSDGLAEPALSGMVWVDLLAPSFRRSWRATTTTRKTNRGVER